MRAMRGRVRGDGRVCKMCGYRHVDGVSVCMLGHEMCVIEDQQQQHHIQITKQDLLAE